MPKSAILHLPVLTIDWAEVRELPSQDAASALQGLLRSLEGIEDNVFAVRGMACWIVEDRELYKELDDPEVGQKFASFDRFLKVTCPKSWSYCRDAMRVVKELREIPFTELVRIRRCNLEHLKKTSSGVRTLPAVIEAARTLPEKALVEKLNREHNQHLEVKQPMVMASADDVAEFESAIQMAMELEECQSRAEAIKAIAVDYLTGHRSEYEKLKESIA